jgi:hypothetical protein
MKRITFFLLAFLLVQTLFAQTKLNADEQKQLIEKMDNLITFKQHM